MHLHIMGNLGKKKYDCVWSTGDIFSVHPRLKQEMPGIYIPHQMRFLTAVDVDTFFKYLSKLQVSLSMPNTLLTIDLQKLIAKTKDMVCIFIEDNHEDTPHDYWINADFVEPASNSRATFNCLPLYLLNLLERDWLKWQPGKPIVPTSASILEQSYHINKDLIFKNQNLKGMMCKIIDNIKRKDKQNSNLFVIEFEKFINGGNGDGLGKQGHCLIVNSNFLSKTN